MNLSYHLPLRSNSRALGFLAGTLLAAVALLFSHSAQALDGTWTLDGSDTWEITNTTPWASGIVAQGADFTALFDTIDITANRTVTLTNPLTIGNLNFGDTAASHEWTLTGSTLTMDTTVGVPTITASSPVTISSVLAGNDGLAINGGRVNLTASNTYTGLTTINSGTTWILNDDAINGDIDLAGGSLRFDNVSVIMEGNITGASGGKIVKTNNSSTLTLLGDNTSNSGTELNDGGLVLGDGANNGIGTGLLELKGGSIQSSDNLSRTIDNNISFGSNTVTYGAAQGASDGLGDLTFTNTGNKTVGGSKSWAVNNDTVVTFNNNWGGNSNHHVTKTGTGTLVWNGDILGGTTGTRFQGNITVNNGTFILNGDRTDSDVERFTTVNGGTLFINGDQSGYTGAVTVGAGGTLGGSGSIGGSLTLDAGADFVFSLTDTLTVGGGVSFGGFSISDLVGLDNTIANGTYTLIDGAINFANVSNVGSGFAADLGGGKSAYFQEGSLQVVVVPEPSTFAMLLGGFGMLLGFQRSRRRK